MTLNLQHNLEIINIMENYLDRERPGVEISNKLDLGYKIEGQSIELFEIRPVWNEPSRIQHFSYARATFIKTKNQWKMYWMRADLKWHGYTPNLYVKDLKTVLEIIDKDEYGSFKG